MITHKCSNEVCSPCNNILYESNISDAFQYAIQRYKDPSGLFVDVGAHVGLHSLRMLAVYEWMNKNRRLDVVPKILAIEPESEGFACLEKNLPPGDKRLLHAIAWSKDGKRMCLHGGSNGGSSGSWADTRPCADDLDIVVPTITLDAAIARSPFISSGAPDAMKIDTEGAEFHVITGAKETLKKMSPLGRLVVVEFCPSHLARFGHSPYDVLQLMKDLDFTPTNQTPKQILRMRRASVCNVIFQGKYVAKK